MGGQILVVAVDDVILLQVLVSGLVLLLYRVSSMLI